MLKQLSAALFSRRIGSFIAAFICFGGVAFSYFYIEKTLYMQPCPLCIMQRLAFILIGLFFLLDAILYPRGLGGKILYLLKLLSIFYGIGLAARHLYIQSLPPELAPSCGLDFYGMVDRYPLLEALSRAMKGTGDCAVHQTWLFLTIPQWSMSIYVALLIYTLIIHRRQTIR